MYIGIGIVLDMVLGVRVISVCADVVIDVSNAVMLGVGVDMVAGFEIIVKTVVMIDSESIIEVSSETAVCADVRSGAMIGGAPDSAEANASAVTPVMMALEFAVPAPLEEPFLRSWALSCCCSMTVLDCARALQACKPSYHV